MEKKFCTSCGAELGNGDFCTSCGARIETVQNQELGTDKFKAVNTPHVKLYDVFFGIGIIALAIVALMYIISCFKYSKTYMEFVDMYDSSFMYVLLYYFIGFWGAIGFAIVFFQKLSKKRYAAGVIQVIILAVIIILIPIINSAFENSFLDSTFNLLLYRISLGYKTILSKALLFDIISGVAFLIGKRIDTSSSL